MQSNIENFLDTAWDKIPLTASSFSIRLWVMSQLIQLKTFRQFDEIFHTDRIRY